VSFCYINYYYFGLVIAAIPTKLLAIVPSIAYNLILPSFFSFTAMASFSIGENLAIIGGKKDAQNNLSMKSNKKFIYGLVTAIFLLIIGNLGTVKMIFQGFQHLGELFLTLINNDQLDKVGAFFEGVKVLIQQGRFNFYPGDWYWIPSRTITGEPITEFPYFTFLYGDPHAHLFSLPITLTVICWSLSTVKNRWEYENAWEFGVAFFTGALLVGALRPTNTWDYPVYFIIACISVIFSLLKYANLKEHFFPNLTIKTRKILIGILLVFGFGLLSYLLFIPFSKLIF